MQQIASNVSSDISTVGNVPMPLCSVVMATYSGDSLSYLADAIRSILEQTYRNLELIVVVDGFADGEYLEKLRQLDTSPQVSVIYTPTNRGPSHARNVGIKMARGEYLAIMDADDISVPDRIEKQLNYLISHNLDFLSTWLTVIDATGQYLGIRKLPLKRSSIRLLSPFRCPLHNPSLFCTTKAIKTLMYDESYRLAEDYDLWVRAIANNVAIANMPECLVMYRQDPESIGRRIGYRYFKSDLIVKIKAIRNFNFMLWPFFAIPAFAITLSRMLPLPLFKLVYRLKNFFS